MVVRNCHFMTAASPVYSEVKLFSYVSEGTWAMFHNLCVPTVSWGESNAPRMWNPAAASEWMSWGLMSSGFTFLPPSLSSVHDSCPSVSWIHCISKKPFFKHDLVECYGGEIKNAALPNKSCPSWVFSSCDDHVLSKHDPGHSGSEERNELRGPWREAHHSPLGEGGPDHQPWDGPLSRVHQGGGRGGDLHSAGKT